MPDTEWKDGYGWEQRAAGNADMVETLIADGAQITSPGNYSVPKWGGSCHPLTSACGNTILIVRYTDEEGQTLFSRNRARMVESKPDRADNPNKRIGTSVVRRLTPLECERLQGYPSEKKVDVSKMTKDEYIAWNIAEKNIIVDAENGTVYATRGPGGCPYNEPKELSGTESNGYKVISIRNGATKLQCRVHRVVWISRNGIIPDGYVVDHINNNKLDNRIGNLQLLTPEENSRKAHDDGLYATGLDNKATKLDPDLKDEVAFLYEYSDMTMRDLAELYGVSKSRIGQIIHEIGWTDIGKWTDSKGKKHKTADSPRYKALGNSIALPFWFWLLRRISAQYERPATLGSLFDGIGGFPLCWERCNGKGTAVWASEIEEFAIAVTKKHFPDENQEGENQ